MTDYRALADLVELVHMIYMLGIMLLSVIIVLLLVIEKCPQWLLNIFFGLGVSMPISWLVFGGCPLMMLENELRAMYDPLQVKETFTGSWLETGFGIYTSPEVIFWALTLLIIGVMAGVFYLSRKMARQ